MTPKTLRLVNKLYFSLFCLVSIIGVCAFVPLAVVAIHDGVVNFKFTKREINYLSTEVLHDHREDWDFYTPSLMSPEDEAGIAEQKAFLAKLGFKVAVIDEEAKKARTKWGKDLTKDQGESDRIGSALMEDLIKDAYLDQFWGDASNRNNPILKYFTASLWLLPSLLLLLIKKWLIWLSR
jgi:hypothetical protein